MKVLLINSVCGIRSTGRICTDIASEYIAKGHECKIAYGRLDVPKEYEEISYRIGTEWDVRINALKARVFDNEGFNAKKQTEKFLNWAEEYNPDELWLHNLHGYYINVEMLFAWIKSRPQMIVKWTLHDCWTFTGHCSHFSYVKCDKWKKECVNCPQKKEYPSSIIRDNSCKNYKKKKNVFCGVKDMTIITPSKWLSKLVQQSFLSEYKVKVINNIIDKNIFKPTLSDLREKYQLEDKIIILGVATAWTKNKGLYDFVELSECLGDKYKIVLVGLNKKQIGKLPKNILCFPKTDSANLLAGMYTAADVFVNLSKEETFGLTTLEALACGTPSIVYKGTACEEVAIENGGVIVDMSLKSVINAINRIV